MDLPGSTELTGLKPDDSQPFWSKNRSHVVQDQGLIAFAPNKEASVH